MWNFKAERLLGIKIPDSITYHNLEYVHSIVLNDNLHMLYRLKSPGMVRLGRLLGVNIGRAGNIHLHSALREKDIPLITSLLEDRALDPENKVVESYINDNEDPRFVAQLRRIMSDRE